MVGRKPTALSADGRRRLQRLRRRLEAADRAYRDGLADLAETESHAAIARELGISRQALHDRLKTHRTENALEPHPTKDGWVPRDA